MRSSLKGESRLASARSGVPDGPGQAYEELRAKGVEFSQEPMQRPYGIDAGFRDPSGNQIRLVQRS